MAGTTQRSVLFARESDQQQAHDLIEATGGQVRRLIEPGGSEPIELPPDLVRIVQQVLRIMANGGTVVISSVPDELTTTVAAEQLGISRPTLMKMIGSGEIAAHKVGSHHRLKASDVQAAKRLRLEKQREAFDELRRLEDELDQY